MQAQAQEMQTKLSVPIRIMRLGQSFAIGPQRKPHFAHQPTDSHIADIKSASLHRCSQLTHGFVRPVKTAHWIARCRIFEQLLQNIFHFRSFFSMSFLPPPARR